MPQKPDNLRSCADFLFVEYKFFYAVMPFSKFMQL